MDETTKILSVSYGNFSCHLEGFDDSVETMKTVVSYFHDLAGHNRFMDMEPQAPDLDTLAELTQEHEDAAVDVEATGNNVSLRTTPAEAEVDADPDHDDAPAADESIATKLQRIRAVVGSDDAKVDVDVDDSPADDENIFTEDLAEDETPTAVPGNPLALRLAELAKRNAERAAEEAGIMVDAEDEDGDLTTEELAELDAEFAAEEAHAEDVAEDDFAEDEFAEDDRADDDGAEDDMAEDSGAEDEFLDDDLTAEEAAELEAAAAFEEENIPAAKDPDEDLAPATKPPLMMPDDTEDEDPETADLDDDLAQAQDETARQDDKRSDLSESVEANMNRIMSQTDERLAEPEGRRHRDAFAQLKAAVAATEAARQLGDPGAIKRDKDEMFRDDLGTLDAEQPPRRAPAAPVEEEIVDHFEEEVEEASFEETEEPPVEDIPEIEEEAPVQRAPRAAPPVQAPVESQVESPAPAPLKLVSSQAPRTAHDEKDAASARLRQIASQKEAAPVAADGFAEFAHNHGATELVDMLEAAAAYICLVEGEDDFSRPQVMKRVQTAAGTEFSREDGLRAFGRLLRLRRLTKLKNGRFQVSENTQYRPEGQAARG